MVILSLIWTIIGCFLKFIFFLIGLAIAIPLLFVLSVVVAVITGLIIGCFLWVGNEVYEIYKKDKKEETTGMQT